MFKKYISIFVCASISFSGCASNSGKPASRISATSSELNAGKSIHQQIIEDFPPLNDPAIGEYTQSIVTKLSAHAARKLNYHVTVLKDERIYAVSAPGGEIYITTSFLTFIRNEAELAAVLGHEVGQQQFLDPQFNPVRKTMDGVTKVGMMVGPIFGSIGALATLGLAGLHAAYARDPDLTKRVKASDKWAMEAMLAESYDPQALIDVLENFAQYDRQLLSLFYDYYQSRPIDVPRLKAAHAEFSKLPLDGKDLQTNFEQYREKTASIQNISY